MKCPTAQLITIAVVAGAILQAQTLSDPNPRLGMQPGGVYSLSDIETLNHINGNMTIRIPLGSLGPDRAGASHGVGLVYNSKIWEGSVDNAMVNPPQTTPVYSIQKASTGGWAYQMGYSLEQSFRPEADPNSCPDPGSNQAIPNNLLYTLKLRVVFPDGSKHLLRPHVDMTHGSTVDNYGDGYYEFGPDGLYGGLCNTSPTYGTLPNPLIYYTTDGTFVRVAVTRDTNNPPNTSWTLYFKNGDYVLGGGNNPQQICDRNNNCVSLDFVITSGSAFADAYFTKMSDEFGRQITVSYNGCPNTNGSCTPASYLGGTDIISAPGFGGSALTWTVKWQFITSSGAQYNAPALSGSGSTTETQPGPEYMVSEIDLPTQSSLGPYSFAYAARWGELTSLTLPTGTVARYTYWLDSPAAGSCSSTASTGGGIPNWYDVLADYPCYKKVSYAGGSSVDEQFFLVINQVPYSSVVAYTSSVFTGPDGGVTTTKFNNCSGSNPNCYSYAVGNSPGNWQSGLPNEIDQPDGSVLTKTWAQNTLYGTMVGSPLGCNGSPACTQLFPYDSQNVYVQQENRTLGGSTAQTTHTVDRNGNPLVTTEYDWSGSPMIRKTTLVYFNSTTDASSPPASNETNVYWNGGVSALLDLISTKKIEGPTSPASFEQYCYDNSVSPSNGNVTLHARSANGASGGTLVTCPATGTASTSAVVTTQFAYGYKGVVQASMDGRSVTTQFKYDPNNLYVTEKDEACNQSLTSQSCTLPERRVTTYSTDLNTGKTTSATDSDNGATITTDYSISPGVYDWLARPTKVTDPIGAITSFQYSDGTNPRYVLTTAPLDRTPRTIPSINCFDQMGRLTMTQMSETGSSPAPCPANPTTSGAIQAQRQYQYVSGGRYEWISNPFRNSGVDPMGWVRRKFDGAGRLAEVAYCSGNQQVTVQSKVTYSYSGACVTVKDEAANATNPNNPGNTRTTCKDAAGRISSVAETINGTQTTTYNYDAFDNLTDVYQASQHRQFRYDSLGRLTSAYNPETGWTTYGYDYNGNLISKTDSRGVTTCFGPVSGTQCNATSNYGTSPGYDGLNRPTGKQYTDGTAPAFADRTPSVTFTYCLKQTCSYPNGVGRLIQAVSNGTTVQYTQFDADGRVLQHSQSNPQMNGGTAAQFSYIYNLAGSLTNVTYPSGRSITTGYDNAGRAAALSGSLGGTTRNYADIASSASGQDRATCTQCIQYAPHGGISQMYLSQVSGGQWAINEQHGYNNRLQPTSITSTQISASQTIRSLTFGYAANSLPDGPENNGNLLSQAISGVGLNSGVTQSYSYDGANRILSASEGSCNPIQGLSYDTWGNNWVSSRTPSCYNPSSFTPTANVYDSATNCSGVNNARCDAAGQQYVIGGYSFTYDAENRMTSATLNVATVYQYDGEGRRVAKINCPSGTGLGTCTAATTGASTVWYVYDAAGELAMEYGQSSLATASPCTTCYLMTDHLGSTRMMMDQNGNSVPGGCHDYLPFGEEIYSGIDGRSSPCYPSGFESGLLFAGKLRDESGESQLDYSGSRYFSGAQGRFTSPDKPFADQNVLNPQSWNLFTYGRNNPLRFGDPNGMECVDLGNGQYGDDGNAPTCLKADLSPQQVMVAGKAPKMRDLVAEAQARQAEAQAEIDRLSYGAWQQKQAANQPKQDVPLPPAAVALVRQPAIATLPVDCGGGVYGYLGQEVGGGPVSGFVGSIAEIDSEHGASAGGLAELGAGQVIVGGAGGTSTLGANGQIVSEGLLYGGIGAHTPLISASAGGVAFGHGPRSVTGVGVYGEAFLLQKGGGGGLYINLSSVGRGCH